MFRRGHLFMLLMTFGICFLIALRMGVFEQEKYPTPRRTVDLQALQDVNTVLTRSISTTPRLEKHPETVKSVEPTVETVKPVELVTPVKLFEPAKTVAPTVKPTPPKPTPEPPLPVLTSEAQDRFYGAGCKVNRYRDRLQKVFNEWRKIVKRRNISMYFICFGSFLGSVRNGDIVPYDSDMDVCMFRHEYHKLYPEESKRPVNLNDGRIHILLQRHAPHPKSNTPRKDCRGNIVRHVADDCAILDPHGRVYLGALIYLDIFLVEDHGGQLWDEYRDRFHDRGTMLPVKLCKYLGLDTTCPNNAEKYLKTYYGDDYMKPHHICQGGRWVQNMPGARRPFV